MPRKKRVNPNRKPVKPATFDKAEIMKRANSGNIVYAWLLVLHTLIYHEAKHLSSSKALEDGVEGVVDDATNAAVKLAWKAADDAVVNEVLSASDIRKAELITGMKTPYINLETTPIRSQLDAEKLYKRAKKNALYNALFSIALGLEQLGYYDNTQLNRVFTNVEITLAEIEEGVLTYDDLMADIDKSADKVGRKK